MGQVCHDMMQRYSIAEARFVSLELTMVMTDPSLHNTEIQYWWGLCVTLGCRLVGRGLSQYDTRVQCWSRCVSHGITLGYRTGWERFFTV